METSIPEGFQFDASRLPILVVSVHRATSDAEHSAYLDRLERYYREHEELAVIFDIRTHELPTRGQARAQGEWMKRHKAMLAAHGLGVAFVFRNAAIRLVFSTIVLIQRMPHQYTVVSTLEEALAWSRERVMRPRRAPTSRRAPPSGRGSQERR